MKIVWKIEINNAVWGEVIWRNGRTKLYFWVQFLVLSSYFSLVSSSGANEKSFFFYPKIKGELEQAVKKLPFKKTQIFQPPILIRQPELIRNGEKIAIKVFSLLNKIGILKSQKPLSVSYLAKKMINHIKSEKKIGIITYKAKEIISSKL